MYIHLQIKTTRVAIASNMLVYVACSYSTNDKSPHETFVMLIYIFIQQFFPEEAMSQTMVSTFLTKHNYLTNR